MNKSTHIYQVKNPNSKTNKGGYTIDHKRCYPCHCRNCDKDFRGSASNKAFCSEECEHQYRAKNHINLGKCLTCQKELTLNQLKKNVRFCNNSCATTYNNAQRTDEENERIREICRNSQKNIMSNVEYVKQITKKRKETISNWSEERKSQHKEILSKNTKIQFENESLDDKVKRYQKMSDTFKKKNIKDNLDKLNDIDFIKDNFIENNTFNVVKCAIFFNTSLTKIHKLKQKLWNLDVKDNFSMRESYWYNKLGQKKYLEYNDIKFIKNNFIKKNEKGDDYFDTKSCCEYFNIAESTINQRKREIWNINLSGVPFTIKTSFPEIKLFEDLKKDFPDFVITKNNWDILINPKTNRKLEIDILIKDKDGSIICGVEYNGTGFHSKDNPEKENFKSRLCEEKGFKLFHIWATSKNEDLENLYSFLRD